MYENRKASQLNTFLSVVLGVLGIASLILAVSTAPCFAQTQGVDQQENTSGSIDKPEVNERENSENPPQANKPLNDLDEQNDTVFRPSEEISEDSPVSFPVDI